MSYREISFGLSEVLVDFPYRARFEPPDLGLESIVLPLRYHHWRPDK